MFGLEGHRHTSSSQDVIKLVRLWYCVLSIESANFSGIISINHWLNIAAM